MANTTDERLRAALRTSDAFAKDAQTAKFPEHAVSHAFYAAACLLFIAGELPDAQGELPPQRPLSGPPDLTLGYAALGLSGPVLADGARFGDWVENGQRHPAQADAVPKPSRVQEWASVVRGAFERKYVRRLRP